MNTQPVMEMVEDKLLTIQDVCILLSFSRAKVYRLLQQGQLPVVRVGGSIRFRYKSILQWMEEHETQPLQEPSRVA
jgi:excisionase family DNA binding protein